MRRPLLVLTAPLLLGLAACGPQEPPEEETATPTIEETATPTIEEPTTEVSPSVEVSDGGGDGLIDDDPEVVQPTETTEYAEQGEDSEDE